MNSDEQPTQDRTPSESASRILFYWPAALVVTTLALFLIANSVSAWGRGGEDQNGFHARAQEHAEHVADRLLRRIDASDEQKERIHVILAETFDEFAALHGEESDDGVSPHREFVALLTADTVDRTALESARASHLERADAMSQILTVRLAEVAEVLTPEQRSQLEERLSKRHGRHGHGPWH